MTTSQPRNGAPLCHGAFEMEIVKGSCIQRFVDEPDSVYCHVEVAILKDRLTTADMLLFRYLEHLVTEREEA